MKEERKKIIRARMDLVLPLASFVVSMGLFLAILRTLGLAPFGDKTLLLSDFKQQYYPFLQGFRSLLKSGGSFFYSTNAGLGYNFWANYAYYLTSPFNVILVLFPEEVVYEGIILIMALKIGAIGLTTNILITRITDHYKAISTAFSTAFALSSFALAYSIHLMWLDALIMAPLCLLGLYKLVRFDQTRLYTLSLAGSIWGNFYMTTFTAVFLVLLFPYFYWRYADPGKKAYRDMGRVFWSFIKASFIGGALVAVLLIPTALALPLTGKGSGGHMPALFSKTASWFEALSRFYPESRANVSYGPANLYVGLVSFLLSGLVFTRRGLDPRAGFALGLLILFLFFSSNSEVLHYLWQGSVKVHFSHRYIYVLGLLLVVTAYDVFISLEKRDLRLLVGLFIVALALIPGMRGLNYWNREGGPYSWILIPIYLMLFILILKAKEGRFRSVFLALLTMVMVWETYSAGCLSLRQFERRFESSEKRDSIDVLSRQSKEIVQELQDFGPFLRIQYMGTRRDLPDNLGIAYNYPSVEIFSTLYSSDTTQVMKHLGYSTNEINRIFSAAHPQTLDPILGLAYSIYDGGAPLIASSISRTEVPGRDGLRVFKHHTSLMPGIFIEKNPGALDLSHPNPFSLSPSVSLPTENLNDFFRILGAHGDLYQVIADEEVEFLADTDTVTTFTAPERGFYTLTWQASLTSKDHWPCLYLGRQAGKEDNKGTPLNSFLNANIELGLLESGQKVDFTTETFDGRRGRIVVSKLDTEAYRTLLSQLQERNMILEPDSKVDAFSGFLEAPSSGYVFFALPYDPGWTFRVNGQKTDLIRAFGGMMALPVSKGPVSIEASFVPFGFYPGLLISLLSCLIFLFSNKKGFKSPESAGSESQGPML